jgi:hypothetical protein
MRFKQDLIYSNMYKDRKYLIFPTSQLFKVDFNQVEEASAETVRKSVDGLKTFIKWDEINPTFISELINIEGPYNYEQMLQILLTPEWSEPIEEL